MPSFAELAAAANPETLRKLLQGSSELPPTAYPQISPYEVQNASRAAQASDYSKLFGPQVEKDLAEEAVRAASIPGKSAAQSAEVFSQAMPGGVGVEAEKSLVPFTQQTSEIGRAHV